MRFFADAGGMSDEHHPRTRTRTRTRARAACTPSDTASGT